MMNLSKFTTNKKILSKVVVLDYKNFVIKFCSYFFYFHIYSTFSVVLTIYGSKMSHDFFLRIYALCFHYLMN